MRPTARATLPLAPTPTCDTRRTDEVVDMLEGKTAFNRDRANFYVYNSSLGSDAKVTKLVIKGTKIAENGVETLQEMDLSTTVQASGGALSGNIPAITWASKSITVTPTLSDRHASARVVVGDGTGVGAVGTGDSGDAITVNLAGGSNDVTVYGIAENGYHDIEYTFSASRATPVDAQLADLGLRITRDYSASAATVDLHPAFDGGTTEYTAFVPEGSGSGSTMPVFILATVKAQQSSIVVQYSDGGTLSTVDALSGRAGDGTNQKVYRVDVAKTGALVDKSVLLAVTGEDATADPVVYDVQLQRGTAPTPGNRPATGAPAISGTARVGMTLDAVQGTIADADGVPAISTWSFQWIRVSLDGATETDIAGATGAEYVVTGDDIGLRLMVEVSFRDGEGFVETLQSAVHPAAPAVVMPPMVSLKLVDDNGATITEIDEGETATVMATLSGAHTGAVMVTVSTDPATGDFAVSTNKVLTIAAGDTESSGTAVTIMARPRRRRDG